MTGRNSCPPEWVAQLQQLIEVLGMTGTGVPLQRWCDAAGQVQGFAGVVYNGGRHQVIVLKFDAQMQPVATFVLPLQPCSVGAC